ncbi:hypothetical protein ABZS29_36425 [Kribbella sp. NPDC005582]|uniref:hypothetical protein n=1 Tax=Kribbella sp. NPDC005582 TaxID=3156893 RepID=UPI0033B868F7
MTQTLVNHQVRALPRRRAGRRLGRPLCLVPVGIQAMADAIIGQPADATPRWRQPELGNRRINGIAVFWTGLVSSVLGLMNWFLLLLFVTSIVRGPTRAGAWAAHAAVSLPIIIGIPFVLLGIAALHAAFVRTVYGVSSSKWVLPATIVLCAGGMLFFWSWIQQL